MEKKAFDARLSELLQKESVEPEQWIYMSFVDNALPKGKRFLGVIVTRAKGPMHATMHTHKIGINPGGEVLFVPLPKGRIPLEADVDRLLTKSEAENLETIDELDQTLQEC